MIYISGEPAPQGSKNAYQRGGRIVLVESSKKLKPWRDHVRDAFIKEWDSDVYLDGEPIRVTIIFRMPKPKTVKRSWPTVKPDLDKLVRAVLDAGTKVLWNDDAQVVELRVSKHYDANPGIMFGMSRIGNDWPTRLDISK